MWHRVPESVPLDQGIPGTLCLARLLPSMLVLEVLPQWGRDAVKGKSENPGGQKEHQGVTPCIQASPKSLPCHSLL